MGECADDAVFGDMDDEFDVDRHHDQRSRQSQARKVMDKQPTALRLADAIELNVATKAERLFAAAELRRLHQVNQELVEALTSIAEYWNQDTNHDAMEDACWYMTDTAKAILAKHKEQA